MIQEAIEALRKGRMILIYDFDDREGETDLVAPAMNITPKDVARMRRDGGGLICVAIHPRSAQILGLPYMFDILRTASLSGNGYRAIETMYERIGDIPYDKRSSFSISVNHRSTFTGITDRDRSLTIREIAKAVEISLNGGAVNFGKYFRSPGHVHILRAADKLLEERKGQTELSIAMAEMAGVTPAMVLCEMLDDETGGALSKQKAIEYASERNLVFIEGSEIVEAYFKYKKREYECSSK
ncbi:MAG: 3,4-dihydroxy-2-butanone-4-phosphate synthase [Methanocellales archaeon]